MQEQRGKTVIIERTKPVIRVILNRPDKLNAINEEMFAALSEVAEELAGDTPFRVLIISGKGKAFCAGGDLSSVLDKDLLANEDALLTAITKIQQILEQVAAVPIPTIAAVHGHTLGAGLQLALACDFRVAEENAKLGLPDVKTGIIPSLGATTRLPRLIGLSRAKELIMKAETIGAEKAHRIGLIHEVVPEGNLERASLDLALKLCRRAPLALKGAKQLLDTDAPLEQAAAVQVRLIGSNDVQEGITAFFEKRAPKFTGS